ncbi:hypothetical protein KPL71_023372 [Citrus sinensis]|uniref:Uncharacterized protein n=1 Tax=Citrus sinensis TaxID=2711 RepID=A0ACB8IKQ6_CITSI|nr:hypothetical protein KPL71_023372 [Citrus sinensis]
MTSNMISSIMQPVNDEEIMRTVFSMHPIKAPGVVGPSVCKVVKEVFGGKSIPVELNKTLIVLIPKNNNPTNLKKFRSVSLYPVVYKIITKIVTNRLKEVLPDLIGPIQTSFIPGRHITKNIVIAQEVVHSMRKKKAGVPMDLVRIIMECISSPTMQLMWNGELTESFIPSRGIPQGDPISPYIFVLCIERLSHGINEAVREGRWKPIKLARQEASIAQAQVIKNVLNTFCMSSGEKVNNSKTLTFFSPTMCTLLMLKRLETSSAHHDEGPWYLPRLDNINTIGHSSPTHLFHADYHTTCKYS